MRFCKVPVDGQDFRVTIKLSRWRCKNHDNSASARSPTDFVPGDETVKVPQDLINGYKFNLLDFGGSLLDSLGCGSQLTKPSELAERFFNLAI